MTNPNLSLPPVDYKRQSYYYREHAARYKRRVETTDDSLLCQACGGEGGEKNEVVELMPGYWDGPWENCAWCLGTGLVTKWIRGAYLRYRKELRHPDDES